MCPTRPRSQVSADTHRRSHFSAKLTRHRPESSLLGKMAKMGLDVREDEVSRERTATTTTVTLIRLSILQLFTSLSAVRHLVEERNLKYEIKSSALVHI